MGPLDPAGSYVSLQRVCRSPKTDLNPASFKGVSAMAWMDELYQHPTTNTHFHILSYFKLFKNRSSKIFKDRYIYIQNSSISGEVEILSPLAPKNDHINLSIFWTSTAMGSKSSKSLATGASSSSSAAFEAVAPPSVRLRFPERRRAP